MAGMPDFVKRKIQEMMGAVEDRKEEMRDKIKVISPENDPQILDEARTKCFTPGQMFEIVQFHISGEVTDHGTSLLSQAVTGGKDIGNDMGYSPATFLTKEDAEKIAKMLSEIPEKEFLAKYSSDDWDQETTQAALIYFKGLVSYYDEAARSGHAMSVWGG